MMVILISKIDYVKYIYCYADTALVTSFHWNLLMFATRH